MVRAGPLVALLLVFFQVIDPGHGAYSAQTTNGVNNQRSAVHYTCNNAALAIGAGGVTGSWAANRYYKLTETTGTTATDSSGSGAHGTYQGGVTYGVAGPCPRDGGRAVTLNGSTGYVSTAAAVTNPTVFSLRLWFRTTTTRGGMLMSFANNVTGNSSPVPVVDRGLHMSDGGRLHFTIGNGNNAQQISSTAAYNDGQWHSVTVTLSGAGSSLYVDGAVVASDATMTSPNSYTGYWRIGYDTIPASWGNQPTSFHFGGSVAHASVHGVALTPQQIADARSAGL